MTWVSSATLGGILDRAWPAVTAAAAITVLATSNVGLNLWFASGWIADFVTIIYAVAMAALAGTPNSLNLHRVAFPLSALFWGGRAGGFLELVIDQDRGDLWGAVAERAAILAGVATLHLISARRIGYTEALDDRGIQLPRR